MSAVDRLNSVVLRFLGKVLQSFARTSAGESATAFVSNLAVSMSLLKLITALCERAGTFVLVLSWWIESKSQVAPQTVNYLFR